jgi:uncharacterized protein CbrC (UPF0167 family)
MRKTKHLKSFLYGIFDDDTAHIAKKGTSKVMTMILCRNVHHQALNRKKHIHHCQDLQQRSECKGLRRKDVPSDVELPMKLMPGDR